LRTYVERETRQSDDFVKTVDKPELEGKMNYSVSYDVGLASVTRERCEGGMTRVETFPTEAEALNRAIRLLDEGRHHAISVRDGSGNVLCGALLQLKLGFSRE